MTLNINGKIQNVKASIEKYIKDNLVTTSSFVVNFEGLPFEEANRAEWIEETILGLGNRDFHRQVSATTTGQTTQVMLNFNIFVNRELTAKTNRAYEIRDILADYFKIGTQIDLYDFSGDDFTTSLQKMEVNEIITDRAIPDEYYSQYNFSVGINWLEQW